MQLPPYVHIRSTLTWNAEKSRHHYLKLSSGHPLDWIYLNSALFVFACRHIWQQWDLPLNFLLFCWAPGDKCWLLRATPKHQSQQHHQQPTVTRLYLFLNWLWKTWCCPFDHIVVWNWNWTDSSAWCWLPATSVSLRCSPARQTL